MFTTLFHHSGNVNNYSKIIALNASQNVVFASLSFFNVVIEQSCYLFFKVVNMRITSF